MIFSIWLMKVSYPYILLVNFQFSLPLIINIASLGFFTDLTVVLITSYQTKLFWNLNLCVIFNYDILQKHDYFLHYVRSLSNVIYRFWMTLKLIREKTVIYTQWYVFNIDYHVQNYIDGVLNALVLNFRKNRTKYL